jgi:hypothetical protein
MIATGAFTFALHYSCDVFTLVSCRARPLTAFSDRALTLLSKTLRKLTNTCVAMLNGAAQTNTH